MIAKSRATLFTARLEPLLLIVLTAVAATDAWSGRYFFSGDGVSYLDMSDAFLKGDWRALSNGYWSPLYPLVLAAGRFLLSRVIPHELLLVHAVNFLIFLAAITAFRFALTRMMDHFAPAARGESGMELTFRAAAWMLFGYGSTVLIGLRQISPDLLVSAFVYLAFGVLLQAWAGLGGVKSWLLLGAALGLGYWAKSFLLVWGVAVLLVSWIRRVRAGKGPAIAAIVFVAVVSPLAGIVSASKERLTFGDSGKNNYAWQINRVPNRHWQGGPEGGGHPLHPSRLIWNDPPVFEFATPFETTYAVWYDPSYWNDGIRLRWNLPRQIRVLAVNLQIIFGMFRDWQVLWLPLLFVAFWNRKTVAELVARAATVAAMGVPFAVYALVHVEGRYVGPFFVLLLLTILSAVMAAAPGAQPLSQLSRVMTAIVLVWMIPASTVTSSPFHLVMANELAAAGLQPRDRVALVGGTSGEATWARLRGLRIVAQVPPESVARWWQSDDAARQGALEAMRKFGVRAFIAVEPPEDAREKGWTSLAGGRYALLQPWQNR